MDINKDNKDDPVDTRAKQILCAALISYRSYLVVRKTTIEKIFTRKGYYQDLLCDVAAMIDGFSDGLDPAGAGENLPILVSDKKRG